jgi:hypothetical protein
MNNKDLINQYVDTGVDRTPVNQLPNWQEDIYKKRMDFKQSFLFWL